jgi:hypothetical protein
MKRDKFVDQIIFDAQVSERKILILPTATLRHTPYNPPSRTKEGAKLLALVEAVRQFGILGPVLITPDRDVIDGNRRLAAARVLGLESVECIVCDVDKDRVFAMLNSNTVPLGGKGWLSVGRGGGWLPDRERAQYDEIFKLVGSYGVDLLISQNIGLNILPLCKQVCALGTVKRLEEVIMATAVKKLTNKLNFELRADKPREEKLATVEKLLSGVA